jgi:hypothetical protein
MYEKKSMLNFFDFFKKKISRFQQNFICFNYPDFLILYYKKYL